MPQRRTEDTVTDLLAQYLRDNGINVETQISISDREGRDQPDIKSRLDNKTFYGEAKWKPDYGKGIGEAYDYSKIGDASATFAVSYPTQLILVKQVEAQ